MATLRLRASTVKVSTVPLPTVKALAEETSRSKVLFRSVASWITKPPAASMVKSLASVMMEAALVKI